MSGIKNRSGIYIRTEEHKKKIGEAKKGNKYALGHKHTEEYKKQKSQFNKGKRPYIMTDEIRNNMSKAKIGKNWKEIITPINERIRKSLEYKLWRKSIFERDNYTCIWCGQWGGKIEADHIKPFALFPELRFAIDNGRTLCKPCHKTTDTWGGKTKTSIK